MYKNKLVVVTGATSGIGLAICKEMASLGANVAVTGRNMQKIQAIAQEIYEAGQKATSYKLDVTQPESIAVCVSTIIENHGSIDYWFNNAGVFYMGEFDEMDETELNNLLQTNFNGAIQCSLAVYRHMKNQKSGHIINIASQAGLMPAAGMSAYSASKHGLVGFSMSLRGEAEAFGVRVSAVCFGLVESEIFRKGNLNGLSEEDTVKWMRFKAWPTRKAVKKMITQLDKNKAYILIPDYTRALWYMNRWFPSFTLKLISHSMKELRKLQTQ